jgi:hypothetical protein
MDYVAKPGAPHEPHSMATSALRTWVPCVVAFLIGLLTASIFFVWKDKKKDGYEPLN